MGKHVTAATLDLGGVPLLPAPTPRNRKQGKWKQVCAQSEPVCY